MSEAVPWASPFCSYRSDSAKMTSSAMTAAPASLSRAINRPTTSRRHGHWPTVVRLRSSTSTMTTPAAGGVARAERKSRSYVESSNRPRREGRYSTSTAARTTGSAPLRTIRRRRDEPRGLDTARLPHRDFDAAIARLGSVVPRLDEQVGLAMRGHLDQRRRDACFNQDALHAHGALQAERDVRLGFAERVGVPDDNDFWNGQPLHGSQDLGNLSARL